METKQKDLKETVRINNQSISSQSKPREVGINVSIEDYDQVYWELNVATNTKELTSKILCSEDGSIADEIDYLDSEIEIHSFPTVDENQIDELILRYVGCYITESELETRIRQEDGDERIEIDVMIHISHKSRSSVFIR